MEDILAIILIFGGGTAVLLSFSPIGRALAERIRHGKQSLPAPELDPAVYEELDMLRRDMVEVQERLAEAREPASAASEEPVAEERPHDEGVSFQCPACGADYDTQETLPEEAEARH